MVEIAIEGIDGAGKGTLMKQAVEDLKHHGFKVGCIDVPRFNLIGEYKSASAFLHMLLARAERRHSTFLLILFAVLSAVFYLCVRRTMKNCDIILTERHPAIDVISYARLYGGAFGAWLAKSFMALWPKPNAVLMLVISPAKAYERLIKRGKVLQPHETVSKLGILAVLLKKRAAQFHEYYFSESNSIEEFHEFLYRSRICAPFL